LTVVGQNVFYPYKKMYDGFYGTTTVDRNSLGFLNDKKPGDFDIILIPYKDVFVHFEMSIVIEVKIVRPTRANPHRNANSIGRNQLWGLMEDGFPYIGLLHVTMTEPLLDKEKGKILHIPQNAISELSENNSLDEIAIEKDYDHFTDFSVERQQSRLLHHNLPECAAIVCIGLDFYETKGIAFTQSIPDNFEIYKGKMNPRFRNDTIKKLESHFEISEGKYTKYKNQYSFF